MTRSAGATSALLLTAVFSAFFGAASAWAPACKLYPQAALLDPARSSPVLSSIAVSDAFDVGSIAIDNLSLTSPRIGALKITLTAVDANTGESANDILKDTVSLKDVNEGGDATGLSSITFDDNVMVPFPDSANDSAATISGSFFPSQDLQTIALGNGTDASGGGSNGTWTLRIVDLSQNSTEHLIQLKSWTLVLCPVVTTVTADNGANVPSASAADTAAAAEAALVPTNALTTKAEVQAANSGETGKLLLNLLDRVTRTGSNSSSLTTTRLNGTPRAFGALANTSSTPVAAEGLLGNQTIMDHIRTRLDVLLGVDDSTPASNASAALLDSSPAASSLLGSFVLGNSTLLPQEPTSKLLQALRSMIDDLSNTSSTSSTAAVNSTAPASNSSFRSAAPDVVAQSGPLGSGLGLGLGSGNLIGSLGSIGANADGTSILSTVSKLLTGTQYLNTIATMASGLQDAIASIPAVKLVQSAVGQATSRVQGTTSNVAESLKSAQDYASSQIQDRVHFLQGQTDMVQTAIKNRISNYEQALTSIGSLISQAINKHSTSLISHAKDIQTVTHALRDQVSQQTSNTAKVVGQHLDTIIKSSSGIGTIAKGLQSDFTAAVSQLVDVYKAHLQTASSILSATSNAALSQAQFRSESAIDQLSTALGNANTALDKLSNGAIPIVGRVLGDYQQGLQFVEAALQGIKSRITTAPSINYGQLVSSIGQGGVLSGALAGQLEQLTSSLGIGSRSTKVLGLLGNIDGFSSRISQLFPGAAAATSG